MTKPREEANAHDIWVAPNMTTNPTSDQLFADLELARQRIAELESAAERGTDRLASQEEKFQLAMDATSDGLWDWYCRDNHTYYSPGYYRMLGYPPEEFPATPQAWLDLVHPDDQELLLKTDDDCVENRIQSFEIELRLKPRSGDWKWILSRGKAISRDETGRALRIIGTHVDITERKRIEEALRQANAELQARNEDLDAFAHTVAHDLKNPLAAIVGFSGVLSTDWAALSTDELDASLRAIARSAIKMDSILNALLLFAEVRQSETKLKRLGMSAIVSEALQRLADLIDKHQASISLPTRWPTALGNAAWVEEVWTNYLSNAIKYGGRPPRLTLGAEEQSDGMMRFWVEDNGAGLTPDNQVRLFSPFTRIDQTRAAGYGLGLSIVRRIIEKLGGQVGVVSTLGAGSTFYFTLPHAD
jgi:PAS domain S-box-containing protein